MGNPAMSCLSIIACGRGHADQDDLELSESGASSDKRRWSFRKRSSQHRVLSNTLISEPLPVVTINKESPEASRDISNPPADPFILENLPSPKKKNEILQHSLGTVDKKVVDVSLTTEGMVKPDLGVQESAAAVIQAAVRGFLARKEMLKLKSIVKLQAAVRGHLVRRQAAGTLRCVQAIVKMQALVRARLLHQSAEKLTNQVKLDAVCLTNDEKSKTLEKETSGPKQKKPYSSTGKLLTNGFARQLLESRPKTKPIHIHCDPSKSDSAWKWLERWMALSSSDVGQKQDLNLKPAYQEESKSTAPGSCEVADDFSSANEAPSVVAKSSPVLPAQTEDLIISGASEFEFQASTTILVDCVSSQTKDVQEHHQPKNECAKDEDIKDTFSSNVDEVVVISASAFQPPDILFDKPEEKLDHFSKRTSDSLETEDKKFVLGTRKVCNPSFAAAQAKFEELSSVGSLKSKSYGQDISVDSRSENLDFDSFTKSNINAMEESVSQDPKVQTATSECGTEISISSTLDSPDRSEAEGGEIVLEIGALERRNCDENGSSSNAFEDLHSDTKNTSQTEDAVHQPSKLDVMNENPTNVIIALDSVEMEQKPSLEHMEEQVSCAVNVHQENVVDQETNRSTPEGSPRSHITASGSHGTPSSQTSVNIKKDKVENNMHRRKRRSQLTVGKRSPSSLEINSGRSSTEHLSKDTKSAKRRNSFGMSVSDHVEHEPRTSTSSSLPSYMQATESARAKAANNSPKSSPDVHKDGYARKRHSLPMGNGKQGSSPRMQHSSSQVQSNAKQNGTHSPHNSAERRWQR